LLVDLFLEAHERAPRKIVLDLDNTDIPLRLHAVGAGLWGVMVSRRAIRLSRAPVSPMS